MGTFEEHEQQYMAVANTLIAHVTPVRFWHPSTPHKCKCEHCGSNYMSTKSEPSSKYYGSIKDIIDEIGIHRVVAALNEGDVSLNTIPLGLWDRYHETMYRAYKELPYPSRMYLRENAISGGWSISSSVCTLKTLARSMAKEQTYRKDDNG